MGQSGASVGCPQTCLRAGLTQCMPWQVADAILQVRHLGAKPAFTGLTSALPALTCLVPGKLLVRVEAATAVVAALGQLAVRLLLESACAAAAQVELAHKWFKQ